MEYNDKNRGSIQFRERAKQLIDFRGMVYGNKITPTDFDGVMEWHDAKTWVVYEFKYNDAQMSYGQRKALEEFVDDEVKAQKEAIAIVCRHYVADPQKDVLAADAVVDMFYWNGKWHSGNGRKCKEFTDSFWNYASNRTTVT